MINKITHLGYIRYYNRFICDGQLLLLLLREIQSQIILNSDVYVICIIVGYTGKSFMHTI